MSYNAKNYTEQGGERTVIGGTLEIEEDGQIIGLPSCFTPTVFQADSVATTIEDLVVDFNVLLLKLKDAGLMENQ